MVSSVRFSGRIGNCLLPPIGLHSPSRYLPTRWPLRIQGRQIAQPPLALLENLGLSAFVSRVHLIPLLYLHPKDCAQLDWEAREKCWHPVVGTLSRLAK